MAKHQEEMKVISEKLKKARLSNNQDKIATMKKYYEKEIKVQKKQNGWKN